MKNNFRPFLKLLRTRGETRFVFQLQNELGNEILALASRAGWLESGAPARHYPCLGLIEGCRRSVVPLAQAGHYDLVALPAEGCTSCEPLHLIHADVRTMRVAEPVFLRALADWLPFQLLAELDAHQVFFRLGRLQPPLPERSVFFARRISTPEVTDQLDGLDLAEPAVVLTPMRDQAVVPIFLARYSGASRVKLLFIEDYVRLRAGSVHLRPVPPNVLRSWPSDPVTGPARAPVSSIAITTEGPQGVEAMTHASIQAWHASWDLLVDATTVVEGGHPGSMRDGSMIESFVLSPRQVAVLVELARQKDRVVPLEDLARVARVDASQMLDVMDEVCDRCDARPSSGVRAIKEHRDRAGQVICFSFSPPEGFGFAILLPLDYGSPSPGGADAH